MNRAQEVLNELAKRPCESPKGDYLPTCTDPKCETNLEGHAHRHFGNMHECGECLPCRARYCQR